MTWHDMTFHGGLSFELSGVNLAEKEEHEEEIQNARGLRHARGEGDAASRGPGRRASIFKL